MSESTLQTIGKAIGKVVWAVGALLFTSWIIYLVWNGTLIYRTFSVEYIEVVGAAVVLRWIGYRLGLDRQAKV